MAACLSNGILSVVQSTYFFKNEAKLLNDAQRFINKGNFQLNLTKKKMVSLCNDSSVSSFMLYSAVEEEKVILENLVKEFNTIHEAVKETIEEAILTCEKSKSHLDKLYSKGRNTIEKFNNSIEILKQKESENEECKSYNVLSLYASFQMCGTVFNMFLTQIDIYGQQDKILDKIMEEKEECLKLKGKIQELEKKEEIKCNLIENQTRKIAVLEAMVKLLCKFHVILRQWQQHLDEIWHSYNLNNAPPQHLRAQVERNQRMFIERVKKNLNNAKPVYEGFEYKPMQAAPVILNSLLYPKTLKGITVPFFGAFNILKHYLELESTFY